MAEAKKAGTPRARKRTSAPQKTPEKATEGPVAEMAAEAAPELPLTSAQAPTERARPRARQPRVPPAEPMQISHFGQERTEALRHAMNQAAVTTARGVLEVNDKILAALQTQNEAALELWRSAVGAPHPSELIRRQSDCTRHAYETASAQWKDIAETTARWFNRSLEPLQAMLGGQNR